MADSGGDDPQPADKAESQLAAALGAFKPRGRTADSSPVSESGRSGLTWSPVIDPDSEKETAPRPRSSFQFDLGSALARLGDAAEPPATTETAGSDDEPAAPLPVRSRRDEPTPMSPDAPPPDSTGLGDAERAAPDPLPSRGVEPADPLPVRGPGPVVGAPPSRAPDESIVREQSSGTELPTVVDRLPTRKPREAPQPAAGAPEPAPAPAAEPLPRAPERPAARAQPSRSVFDGANPTPTLPTDGLPDAAKYQPAAPSLPTAPVGDGPLLPTLPAAVPAAHPSVIAPIEAAPSTPDLNALRSAQLRANRNDRHGKLFGRSLLALVVVGALVAGSLLFGRSYLFPTAWDPALTPLVDDVQRARQTEFDRTIPISERPASEYAPLVTAHVLGADWNTRLPEWRALGLAAGDGAVADVQVRIAALYPAFFDPESDTIVVSAERSTEAREAALLLALESALARQLADDDLAPRAPLGLTGLESPDGTARRAFDAAAAGLTLSAPEAVADLIGVPIPVAYQLRAIDSIGAVLAEEVATPRPGDALPPSAARLDDVAISAPGGLRQPGDQQVLEPAALGTDDWALIWGARLSPSVVAQMVATVDGDSYAVVSRSGVTCFIAVFQTASEAVGASLFADLNSWAARAPAGTQAVAVQLGPNRVQVEGCDPGADAASVPSSSAVDLVIGRQLDRVAG